MAKALGLAKKAFPNSSVEYTSFDSGRDVNTAVAAKGIDFGLIGSVGVGVGIAQNLPYQVYFIRDVIGTAEALIVRENIKALSDLAGKKVAVPFGSTTHFALLSLLSLEKIDANSLTLLDLKPQDLLAAWQRKDIDAGYIWDPVKTKLLGDGGKVLTSSAELAKRGVITADVGIVTTDFATKYPDAVKTYVKALDEAVEFYRKDPEAAAKAIAPELNLTPEQSKTVAAELIWLTSKEQATAQYLGTPDKPGDFAKVLKDSADFMVKQKAITSAPELSVYQKNIWNKALS